MAGPEKRNGFSIALEKARQVLTGPKSQIHNTSGTPVCLIPISCNDGEEDLSSGNVEYELAEVIPARGRIVVDNRKYDLNGKKEGFQIYVFFRAGTNIEDEGKSLLTDLRNRYSKGVGLGRGEKPFLHSQLDKLNLACENGKVIMAEDAGQADPPSLEKGKATKAKGGQKGGQKGA